MITEIGNNIALYDLTRPFVWRFKSPTATNLVYVIQKRDTNGVFVNISGILRQPVEFASGGEFYINPSEILADELKTLIRPLNEHTPRVEFDSSIEFRLLMTEEVAQNTGVLAFISNQNLWYGSTIGYGIDAATQHEETYNLNQATWFDMYRLHAQTAQLGAKFLTNKPFQDISMSVTDSEYAYIFINAKKHIFALNIYDIAGNTLDGYTYNNLSYGINCIGIGVPNIIANIGQSNWDAVANTAHTVKYFVTDLGGTEKSELGSYKINKEACTTERLRVYWKNRKGGIDGYTFNSELTITTNSASKLSKRYLGYRRINSENDYNDIGYRFNNTYNSSHASLSNTSIVANERLQVTSKHEKATVLKWLYEIITSPQVFVENVRTGQINAVYSITKKATTKPKGLSLGQMKLTLAMSNEIMTQR